METFVQPLDWDRWPEAARIFFEGLRSSAGEEMILQKNEFVEKHLPRRVLRGLSEDEMAVYRRPVLTWPREVPLGGEPADVV